jgi:hypothetical protein
MNKKEEKMYIIEYFFFAVLLFPLFLMFLYIWMLLFSDLHKNVEESDSESESDSDCNDEEEHYAVDRVVTDIDELNDHFE